MPDSLRNSSEWNSDTLSGKVSPHVDSRRIGMGLRADGKLYTYSLSGSERNHLFMSQSGRQFSDVSLVSGLDVITDSRSFALLDYDRDGWQDIALVNANSPLLNLFHNEYGNGNGTDSHQMIAMRFVGGNDTNSPSSLTCRDGIGTVAVVSFGKTKLVRELHCGEGLAARNSSTMTIGIGPVQIVDSVEIRWPSGRKQKAVNVPAGSLITAFEMPVSSTGLEMEPYRMPTTGLSARIAASRQSTAGLAMNLRSTRESSSTLRMYTTMATWCPSCKKLMPQLKQLRTHFDSNSLEMFGVPADPSDTPDKLERYEQENRPPYVLLTSVTKNELTTLARVLNSTLTNVALPSTIVTDDRGNVLRSFLGVPSVSQIGKLLSGF